jgi:hypothetical protein
MLINGLEAPFSVHHPKAGSPRQQKMLPIPTAWNAYNIALWMLTYALFLTYPQRIST